MDGTANLTDATVSHEGGATDARLREFNHRVLNSLSMISSIIGIESRALQDGAGREALERVRARLAAVSSLYRVLDEAESGSRVRADLYLQNVAGAVSASVGSDERIAVEVRAAACELTTAQAAAVGLVTNEAMTNAYKHAFPGRSAGRIAVSLSEGAGTLTLAVADDGRGMDGAAQDGLGATLIRSLAVDLAGEVAVTSNGEGTRVRVRFPSLP